MDNGMSLSDIAAVTGGKNDGFLEGNGIIIFIYSARTLCQG